MKRHRFDPISLVFGVLFLGVVVAWGVAQVADLPPDAYRWIVAVGLVLLGVTGLIGALLAARRRHADDRHR